MRPGPGAAWGLLGGCWGGGPAADVAGPGMGDSLFFLSQAPGKILSAPSFYRFTLSGIAYRMRQL